jgi:hypothetical protein
MANDYIPRKDGELLVFAQNYLAVLIIYKIAWGVIDTVVTDITTALAHFRASYEAANSPNSSKLIIAKKNSDRDALIKQIRGCTNAYIRFNTAVSDDQRREIRVHVKDTTRTPIPPPSMQVEADLALPGIHLIELVRIRAVAGSVLNGRSDYGVRIYYGIMGTDTARDKFRLNTPPETGSDLPHSVFTRKKRHLFDFDGESGKTVFFCLRYENSKGEAGPFGPIISAVIP